MNAGRLTWLAAGLCLLALATAAPASAQIVIASSTRAASAPTPSPTVTPAAGGRVALAHAKPAPTPTSTPTPLACRLMTSPDSASLALQLTGQDSWVDGTLGTSRVGNGCPGGWRIDASTTSFTSGARSLPADALRVTGAAVKVLIGVAPTNDLAYPINLIANAPPARIFRATGSSGIGVFELAPSVRLHVPADAYAGSYSGRVTLTLVAGP